MRSNSLAAVLQAEHEALAAFVSLLQAEQEILVHGDAQRLAQLAPDKERQVERLSSLGAERTRLLQDLGLVASAAGMESWLHSQPKEALGTLRKLWRELLHRAEAARALNQSNGVLIESKLQQNRLRLSVLQSAASPAALYRADGLLHAARRAATPSQA